MSDQKKKKPFYTKWWFIAIVALFILGGIGAAMDDGEDVAGKDKKENKVAANAEKPPVKEMTIEEQVNKIITDELGKKNNAKKPRIVESADVETPTGHNIVLTLNAKENSSRAKEIMWEDTAKIMEPLSDIEGTENISLEWLYPLQDQYGNSEDSRVMLLVLNKETRDKINWESFDFTKFPDIADEYFEHPALSK